MAGVSDDATLAWYVGELVGRLADGDRPAFERLRDIVAARRARITLEHETVEVSFDQRGELVVVAVGDDVGVDRLDGEGRTTHRVVLELLDGHRDLTDAVLAGDVEARGSDAAVTAMFAAIEILVDSATRIPELRRLAEDYVSRHAGFAARTSAAGARWSWPVHVDPPEDDLLAALGLDHDA
jgi:hypothetical protein